MGYVNNTMIVPEDLKKIRNMTYIASEKSDLDTVLGLKPYLSDIKLDIKYPEMVDFIERHPDGYIKVDVKNNPKHFSAYGYVLTSDVTKNAIFIGDLYNKGEQKSIIIDLTKSTFPHFLKQDETKYTLGLLRKDDFEIANKREILEAFKATADKFFRDMEEQSKSQNKDMQQEQLFEY